MLDVDTADVVLVGELEVVLVTAPVTVDVVESEIQVTPQYSC